MIAVDKRYSSKQALLCLNAIGLNDMYKDLAVHIIMVDSVFRDTMNKFPRYLLGAIQQDDVEKINKFKYSFDLGEYTVRFVRRVLYKKYSSTRISFDNFLDIIPKAIKGGHGQFVIRIDNEWINLVDSLHQSKTLVIPKRDFTGNDILPVGKLKQEIGTELVTTVSLRSVIGQYIYLMYTDAQTYDPNVTRAEELEALDRDEPLRKGYGYYYHVVTGLPESSLAHTIINRVHKLEPTSIRGHYEHFRGLNAGIYDPVTLSDLECKLLGVSNNKVMLSNGNMAFGNI